jgi:hypothetical protein
LKIKSEKSKKGVKGEEKKIMGVFSNELLAEVLDKIKVENDESYFEDKG